MLEDYKKLILSGAVFIKYIDDHQPRRGDLRLFLNNDATSPFLGDYEYTGLSGYFKAEVYDGKFWQLLDLDEFLENREYKFAKKQSPMDTALYCKEILSSFIEGEVIYRIYRGHFTRNEYVKQVRVTRANRNRK